VKPQFDFWSGYYIDFTNKMERKLWYRMFAFGIISYTVFAVVYMLYIEFFGPDFKTSYLSTQLPSILQMVYAAWKLKFASVGGAISTSNPSFKLLRFRRSRFCVLNQSNKEFVMQLETAIYRARYGRPGHLHKMLDLKDVDIRILDEEWGTMELDDTDHPERPTTWLEWLRGEDTHCEDPHCVSEGHDPESQDVCKGCVGLMKVLKVSEELAGERAKSNATHLDTFLCPNIRTLSGSTAAPAPAASGPAPLEEGLLSSQKE
jgi:hypothetical protein